MAVEIKQGVGEQISILLPFDLSLLSSFSVDLVQDGEIVATKRSTECTVSGSMITAAFTAAEANRFAPRRFSVNMRGVYADGGTVIIEEVPGTIRRSSYRG